MGHDYSACTMLHVAHRGVVGIASNLAMVLESVYLTKQTPLSTIQIATPCLSIENTFLGYIWQKHGIQ